MIRFFSVSLAFAALVLVVACAGIKKSPEDKQKQAFDDFRGKIADVIEDPEREAQAIALVSELQQNFFDVRDATEASGKGLVALNADYDALREDLEAELKRNLIRVQSERRTVVDAHRQLRKIMTEEEWDAVDKSRSRALNTAVKQLLAD